MSISEQFLNNEMSRVEDEYKKGREYHLRLDDMTGMRNKELLYFRKRYSRNGDALF